MTLLAEQHHAAPPVPARPVVAGLGHAVPGSMDQQELWDGFFRHHYGDDRVARAVWAGSGIRTRHGVANPCEEDVTALSTGERMRRFLREALPLGAAATTSALERSGLAAGDVGLFAVASCTGYATPGLDALLADRLGMPADVQRLHVGHMGCFAALPGLGAVSDFVTARGRAAVLLCVELTSLHVQPAAATVGRRSPEELQQVVAHALFSDAAAAAVLLPRGEGGAAGGAAGAGAGAGAAGGLLPAGLEVVDVVARTDASTADHMTWDVTDLGFRMGLSPRVPDVLGRHVADVVGGLLARHDLEPGDVAGWAVHPGGRRIVDVVGRRLGLDAAALGPSYGVLADHGNCSSATVLLVLERLLADPPPALAEPGAPVVLLAFGPGLTLYAVLLRRP